MAYIEAIYDCETQTETIVEKEFTETQLAAQIELQNRLQSDAALLEAKSALLAKLGISEEEAKLLLS